jgi:serine/threonine protein kinase
LLLDSEGHIYLTDFNCSISTKERIPYSKAGTLEYMAPEMFSGLHYTFSVDWWSMGVVLYQLAYGNSPFKEKTPEATIDAIISKQLEYLGNHDPVLIDFIKGLLEKNSTTRLGCTNNGLGFNDQIKPHALFDGLDWTRLSEMNVGHTPFPTYNYDTKTNQTPMSEDKLSQRVKSIKKKNSGWLVSRVSTAFSCKSIKTDSHSESNLTELGTKSKELMEREMMEKYFVQYNFQSTENVPAVMPPALVGRKRPEGHGQSKVKDHPQVSIPTSRKLTEKSSPLRIGAPESSPNSIQRLKSVKPNQDQCLSPC